MATMPGFILDLPEQITIDKASYSGQNVGYVCKFIRRNKTLEDFDEI